MKKLLLAFIFVISGFTQLNSQATYHPMLVDSNVWAVYIDVIPILQPQPHNASISLSSWNSGYINTIKDTVVDSLSYTMFYSRTHEGNMSQWSLLREDPSAQQVFLLSAGDTAERMIYDFSLNAGDSIWLDFMYQGSPLLVSGWWYVDSTNTYMIDAGPRKALYLSNPNNPQHWGQPRYLQWIESVGCNLSPLYLDETTEESVSGIEFNMPSGCSQNRHLYSTTCAWQDSVRTFNSECWEAVRQSMQFWYPAGDSCVFNLMGGIHDPVNGIASVKLIPNPASNSTLLEIDNAVDIECSITISNVLGQTMKNVVPLTWYATGIHTIEIDLSGLPTGIYSVNLIGETGVKAVKLVVQ